MLFRRLILSIPMSFAWMFLTGQINIEGFLVGIIAGFTVITLVQGLTVREQVEQLPQQIIALFRYITRLSIDIVLSGIDVARRIIDPRMPLKSGIIAIEVGDETNNELITAISAHGITITPGSLVVDFDGTKTMYVHCLDVEDTYRREVEEGGQAFRVEMIRRILGEPDPDSMTETES